MNKSFVLERNRELGLRNIITSYCWDNETIEEGFNKRLKRYERMNDVTQDITDKEVKEYLKNYYSSLVDKKNFDKFIKRLKEYYCTRINNKDLLKEEGLDDYFNSIGELHCFIVKNVIPVIMDM